MEETGLAALSGTAPANDDPKASATYRAMKAVVIILGVLIVLAFGALIVGAGLKLAGHHRAADAGAIAALPPGARITTIETSGNRLILGLRTGESDEVDIIDTDTSRLVARIKPAPPDVPK